jgi:hypothetical protein
MVKRVLAETRAIWAGGMPQASFAMSKAWMKTSNVGRTISCPSGRWDVEDIVETRGRCEKSAREAGGKEKTEA